MMTSFVREGAVLMTWSRRNFWWLVLRIVLVVTRRAEWRGGEECNLKCLCSAGVYCDVPACAQVVGGRVLRGRRQPSEHQPLGVLLRRTSRRATMRREIEGETEGRSGELRRGDGDGRERGDWGGRPGRCGGARDPKP